MNIKFKRFDSPEVYADYLKAIPAHYQNQDEQDWAGEGFNGAVNRLINGDTSRLAQAQAIIDKLDLAHIFSNDVPVLTPSIAGFIPNVPAAIAGHPEAMFRRGFVDSPSVLAPLTVYVECVASGGVTQDQLIARGVAVLAFVLAMEVIRPVDLYIALPHSHSRRPGVYCPVIKIQSRPMDLGRAVFMLTNPCFARRMFHTAINDLSGCGMKCGQGPWAWNSNPTDPKYEQHVRDLLQMQPEDVFMKGGYLTDQLMLTNPIEWVKKMIEKHRGSQDEQVAA